MVGIVEEVGAAVTTMKPGDRVTVNVETFCGECFFCRNGWVNNCTDPNRVISELRDFIDGSGADTKILAASFKNVSQVTDAFAAGAHSATVDPGVIKTGLAMSSVKDAVAAFTKDFSDLHGDGKTMIDM